MYDPKKFAAYIMSNYNVLEETETYLTFSPSDQSQIEIEIDFVIPRYSKGTRRYTPAKIPSKTRAIFMADRESRYLSINLKKLFDEEFFDLCLKRTLLLIQMRKIYKHIEKEVEKNKYRIEE